MEWEQIRAYYVHLFEAAGKTQEEVALAGGLNRQNQISRVFTNKRKGPTVETFVKAVIGLGVPPSEFFAQLEQSTASDVDLVLRDAAGMSLIEVKRASSQSAIDPARFAAAQAAFWQVLAGPKRAHRKQPRRRR